MHIKPFIKVARVRENGDLELPEYKSAQASGMDLYADIKDSLFIYPGKITIVGTGIAVEIPDGFEIQIRPRSGLAIHHGVTVVNSPGTIDADYRGEIRVALVNLTDQPYPIWRGDRIAQMIVAPVARVIIAETTIDQLSTTKRGAGGFGHTGV